MNEIQNSKEGEAVKITYPSNFKRKCLGCGLEHIIESEIYTDPPTGEKDYESHFVCPACGDSQSFRGLCWGCMHKPLIAYGPQPRLVPCVDCSRKDTILRELLSRGTHDTGCNAYSRTAACRGVVILDKNCDCGWTGLKNKVEQELKEVK